MVKEILDKHGAEGMKYLISIPPMPRELNELSKYRAIAFKYLEKRARMRSAEEADATYKRTAISEHAN